MCVLLYLFTWLASPHLSDSCPHAGDLENWVNYSNASVKRRKVTNTQDIKDRFADCHWLFLSHNEEDCFSCRVALGKPMLFYGILHSCEDPWEALQDYKLSQAVFIHRVVAPFHNPPMCLRLVEKENHKVKYLNLAGSSPTRCWYTCALPSLAATLDHTPAGECHLAPSRGSATAHQDRRTELWNQPGSSTD